jgi:hypothetical protein
MSLAQGAIAPSSMQLSQSMPATALPLPRLPSTKPAPPRALFIIVAARRSASARVPQVEGSSTLAGPAKGP